MKDAHFTVSIIPGRLLSSTSVSALDLFSHSFGESYASMLCLGETVKNIDQYNKAKEVLIFQ